MGFRIDLRIIYTKNKFEAYLNTEESNSFLLSLDYNVLQCINLKSINKRGTYFRNNFKNIFNNMYEKWLESKKGKDLLI